MPKKIYSSQFKRALTLSSTLVIATSLAACAQLPTSGEVTKAPEVVASSGSLAQRAPEPVKGATPLQIVRGFLQACAAGSYDNYVGARKFLTGKASNTWKPEEGIAVLDQDEGLQLKEDLGKETQLVLGSSALVMKVDSSGVGRVTEEPIDIKFQMQKVGEEWRIANLPDGAFLTKNEFNNSFTRWPVYFLSLDGHSLVSDPRWVARSRMTEQLTKYLLAGPSPSLTGTVESAFKTIKPGKNLVRLESNQATINLPDLVEDLPAAQINELYHQFQATLIGVDNINSVQLATANKNFPAPPLTANNLKMTSDRLLGIVDGQVVEQTERYTKVVVDKKSAGSGQLSWAVTGTGTDAPLVANDNQTNLVLLRRGKQPQVLYSDQLLRIPVVDSRGWIWTGSQNNSVTLPVFDVEGNRIDVATPWAEGVQLMFLTLNSQGSRALAILKEKDTYSAQIMAVKRGEDGKPESLVQATPVWSRQLVVTSAVWLDDNTAAFLTGGEAPKVITVPVNSYLEYIDAPVDGVYLVANSPNGVVQIVTENTDRFNRVGNIWRRVSTGLLYPSYSN